MLTEQELINELLRAIYKYKHNFELNEKHYEAVTYYLLLSQQNEKALSFGEFEEYTSEGLRYLEVFIENLYTFDPYIDIPREIKLLSKLDLENVLKRVNFLLGENNK